MGYFYTITCNDNGIIQNNVNNLTVFYVKIASVIFEFNDINFPYEFYDKDTGTRDWLKRMMIQVIDLIDLKAGYRENDDGDDEIQEMVDIKNNEFIFSCFEYMIDLCLNK